MTQMDTDDERFISKQSTVFGEPRASVGAPAPIERGTVYYGLFWFEWRSAAAAMVEQGEKPERRAR